MANKFILNRFPSMIADCGIDSALLDLAEHLLSIVIPSASPIGCTTQEINKWVAEEAVKLPSTAFDVCVLTLESVLAGHPGATKFLPDFVATKERARAARKMVFEFEQARTLVADLKLENSAALYGKLGIPAHLITPLKKTGQGEDWYPPPPYLSGRDHSGLPWGTPVMTCSSREEA